MFTQIGRVLAARREAVSTGALVRQVDPASYYLAYPDVAASEADPVEHYLKWGRFEGRLPGRRALIRSIILRSYLLPILRIRARGRATDDAGRIRSDVFQSARFGALGFAKLLTWLAHVGAWRRGSRIICGVYDIVRVPGPSAGIETRMVAPARGYTFREPALVGEDRERPLREVAAPAQWTARIEDATVIPGFQVIRNGDFIVYEPAGDPRNGFVAGVQFYAAQVRGHADKVAVVAPYDRTIQCESAILLSGRCSPNYFHVLIEYISKLSITAQFDDLKSIPLIVDEGMFPQEWEALDAVFPQGTLMRIDARTVVKARNLHVVSQPTYLRDNLVQPPWLNAALSTDALAFLRGRVFAHLGLTDAPRPRDRLVYLARRTGRLVRNGDAVEAALRDLGFETVFPEDLSFAEQVRMFDDAGVIVGALGAAFTNLIFASPQARVVALASPLLTDFCVQSNLAAFAGCSYVIFPGTHPLVDEPTEAQRRDVDLVMDSFSVDAGRLKDFLTSVLADGRPSTQMPAG